jgi:hypothetical protein
VVHALAVVAWSLLPLAFVQTGSLIVTRQPRNIIGLLLMIPGLFMLAGGVADGVFGPLAEGPPLQSLTPGLWIRL